MRMVSSISKISLMAIMGVSLASAQASASPYLDSIVSAYGGGGSEPNCSAAEKDEQKQKCMSACSTEVQKQKQAVEKAIAKAKAKDAGIVAKGTSAAKDNAAALAKAASARNSMNKGAGVSSAGSDASKAQAGNARELVEPLNTCSSEIESKCSESDVGSGPAAEAKKVADKCKQAAGAAEQAAAGKDAEAAKMAENEKKGDENGKGMEPPKMPEMPKQEEKPKAEAPKSDVTTPEKVAGSSLSGNQLAGNKVGIGGTDDKTAESKTGVFNPGNGASFDSGISSAKPEMFTGAPAGSGSEGRNSSGSSSMGSLGAGGGGEGGAAGPAALAPALAKASEDLEGYSNGSSRPSFLGMKSKGNDSLADLGLDAGAPLDSTLGGAEPTRDLATTDQNAGIHTEDSGSIFTMVRSRIKEIGRRGAI